MKYLNLAFILLLCVSSIPLIQTQTISKRKSFKEIALVGDQTVSLPLPEFLNDDVIQKQYAIEPETAGVSISGLMKKVQSDSLPGNLLRNCRVIHKYALHNYKYIALCEGKKIIEITAGYKDGKFITPTIFEKNNVKNIKEITIPGVINISCSRMIPFTESSLNLFYSVTCSCFHDSKSKYLIVSVYAKNNGENEPLEFQISGNYFEKSGTEDLLFDYQIIPTRDGSEFYSWETYQESSKKGFVIGKYKMQNQSFPTIVYSDRQYVPFNTITAATNKPTVDTNFVLSTISWVADTTNKYAILAGYIPDIAGGGKLGFYRIKYNYSSTGTQKFSNFIVMDAYIGKTLKSEDWGDLKNMYVGGQNQDTTFWSYLRFQALSFKRSQWFNVDKYTLAPVEDLNSHNAYVKYYQEFVPLKLKKTGQTSFPRPMLWETFDRQGFAVYNSGYIDTLTINDKKYKTLSVYELNGLNSYLSFNIVNTEVSEINPQKTYYAYNFNNRIDYFEPQNDIRLEFDSSKVTSSTKINLKVTSYSNDQIPEAKFEISIKKLSKWNDQSDVSHFEVNEICTYGGYWIDVPLGEENISGNGVSVIVKSDGRSKEQLDVKMTHLRKFNMTFKQGTSSIDGIFPLYRVPGSTDKQYYFAYKNYPISGETVQAHRWWLFECTDIEANTCTQHAYGSIDGKRYKILNIGESYDKYIVNRTFAIFVIDTIMRTEGVLKLVFNFNNETFQPAPKSYKKGMQSYFISNIKYEEGTYWFSGYRMISSFQYHNSNHRYTSDTVHSFVRSTPNVDDQNAAVINRSTFINEVRFEEFSDLSQFENNKIGSNLVKYHTEQIEYGPKIIKSVYFKPGTGVGTYVKLGQDLTPNPVYSGSMYTTCMMKEEIVIFNRRERKVIFIPMGDREAGQITFTFAELKIKKIMQTLCLSTHSQILYISDDNLKRIMTVSGEKSHRADEKIHSILKISDNAVYGFNSYLENRKIITTFIRNDLPLTSDKMFIVIYLDGPGLKIDTKGMDKDVAVKISAKAAYDGQESSEKTFNLKMIKNDITTKVENKASTSNQPDFTPGKWVELEKFAVVSGPVIDLTLRVEDEADRPMLEMVEIQSRKHLYAELQESPKENDQSELQIAGDFLLSIHDRNQIYLAYKVSKASPEGEAQTHHKILNQSITTTFSRLRSVKSNDKRVYFSFSDLQQNKAYLYQANAVVDGKTTNLNLRKLIDLHPMNGQINNWLFGDDDDIFYVECGNSKINSWRIRWFRETKSTGNYQNMADLWINDEYASINKFKTVFKTRENHLVILTTSDKTSKVYMTQIFVDDSKTPASLQSYKFLPFNPVDEKDERKQSFKYFSCSAIESTSKFQCLIGPNDAGAFLYEYNMNIIKKQNEKAPIFEQKLIQEYKLVPGYNFESGIATEGFTALCLKRKDQVPYSGEKKDQVLDSQYVIATYTKESAGQVFSVIGSREFGNGATTPAPTYAIDQSVAKYLFIGNPEDTLSRNKQIKWYNIKPLEIRVKKEEQPQPKLVRILQEPPKKLDLSKLLLSVKSLNIVPVETQRLTLKEIENAGKKESPKENSGSGSWMIWVTIILLIAIGAGAAYYFLVLVPKQKESSEGGYVKSTENEEKEADQTTDSVHRDTTDDMTL